MFKDSSIYLVVRLINGVLALASIHVLTRLLSAEQYGVYALGMASIGVGASVCFQWIAVSVSRFYAAHRAVPELLLGASHGLMLRVAALAALASMLLAWWRPMFEPVLWLIVGAGVIAMGWFSLGLQVANARRQPLRYGLLMATRSALALILAVAFSRAGLGGLGAVLGAALGCVICVVALHPRSQTGGQRANPALRRDIVAYGLPLTATYLATMVLDFSDRFMIGGLLGPSAVAGYAVAYDLPQQVVGAVMNVLFLAAYPHVTAAWESGGAPAARHAMTPLFRAMVLFAPLGTGIFIGWAPEISRMVFGAAVRDDAVLVMPWIALAIGVACFKSFFLDIAFQLVGTLRVQLCITISMAVLNVVLNLLLIPPWGLLGAALSTAAAFLAGALLSWWFGRRHGIYPTGVRRDAASTLCVLLAVVVPMHLVPAGEGEPVLAGALRLLAGLAGYVAAVSLLDVAGIRSKVVRTLGRQPA